MRTGGGRGRGSRPGRGPVGGGDDSHQQKPRGAAAAVGTPAEVPEVSRLLSVSQSGSGRWTLRRGERGGVVLVVLLGVAAHCCTCAIKNRERPVVSRQAAGAHLCHCRCY